MKTIKQCNVKLFDGKKSSVVFEDVLNSVNIEPCTKARRVYYPSVGFIVIKWR